jgi:hypothetical protein
MKGSEFLEKVKSSYDEVELNQIDIDDVGTVYYKPMTLVERGLIQKLAKNGSELPASTIVVKALDENGDRMFNNMQKVDLMRGVEANLLDDIATQMVEVKTVKDRVLD